MSRRPRLADWGEYAAAVYEVMGWGAETFLKDWDEVVKVQNQATLDGSPVAQTVIKFMEDKKEHVATSSALHKKLEAVAEELGLHKDRAWPKSARWLWKRIKEVLPVLAAVGIEATRGRDESAKQITLQKVPTNDGSDGRKQESRTDEGKTTANTDPDDGKSNGRSNGSENPAKEAGSATTATTANRYGSLAEAVSEVAAALRDLFKSNANLPNHPPDYLAHELWLWCDFDDPPPVEVVKEALKEVGR